MLSCTLIVGQLSWQGVILGLFTNTITTKDDVLVSIHQILIIAILDFIKLLAMLPTKSHLPGKAATVTRNWLHLQPCILIPKVQWLAILNSIISNHVWNEVLENKLICIYIFKVYEILFCLAKFVFSLDTEKRLNSEDDTILDFFFAYLCSFKKRRPLCLWGIKNHNSCNWSCIINFPRKM